MELPAAEASPWPHATPCEAALLPGGPGEVVAVPVPAWVLAARLALAAVPCLLPCNGDKPKGRCRAMMNTTAHWVGGKPAG